MLEEGGKGWGNLFSSSLRTTKSKGRVEGGMAGRFCLYALSNILYTGG